MADIKDSKLLDQNTGILKLQDACVVLIKTEWNATIVDEMENGCRSELKNYGIKKIETITVPGAFEIPFAIKTYWQHSSKKKKADTFIALGCVMRGDTPHFEYVCRAVTDGIVKMNHDLPVPTIFGILTVENSKQAEERIGGKHGHRGKESAIAALKMIALNRKLSQKK